MRKPEPLEFTLENATSVVDEYEVTMADANILEGIAGKQAVFDLIVRQMPTNQVIGSFERNGIKYKELAKRNYLVNAGLEQLAAYLLDGKGTSELREYHQEMIGIKNPATLDWLEHFCFQGDLYAMPEGTIFFAQEHQLRLHERFEEAQMFEGLVLNTVNPQTEVATTANDIAQITNKILLGGDLRRAKAPQASMFNARAMRIGGFHATSNVAYGMIYKEKAGGTVSHSYIMLHPSEYSAFKAQVKLLGARVIFLLDTYNVKEAFETAMKLVKEEKLDHFGFRLDSGNLLEDAKWIHSQAPLHGYKRSNYTLVGSDDLNAIKIATLEKAGADFDKYLIGTYAVNSPEPVAGVLKLAAYAKDGQTVLNDSLIDWVNKAKISQDFGKSTLPGIRQVYRVTGKDGFYKKDIIAFEAEDLSSYLEFGETPEGLLVPIALKGEQVYDFPTIDQASAHRREQLSRFKDIANYPVIISDQVKAEMERIRAEHHRK